MAVMVMPHRVIILAYIGDEVLRIENAVQLEQGLGDTQTYYNRCGLDGWLCPECRKIDPEDREPCYYSEVAATLHEPPDRPRITLADGTIITCDSFEIIREDGNEVR